LLQEKKVFKKGHQPNRKTFAVGANFKTAPELKPKGKERDRVGYNSTKSQLGIKEGKKTELGRTPVSPSRTKS